MNMMAAAGTILTWEATKPLKKARKPSARYIFTAQSAIEVYVSALLSIPYKLYFIPPYAQLHLSSHNISRIAEASADEACPSTDE